MPRPTTSGTPYLVLRPDSGKYAYWRNLDPRIAPSVFGSIVTSWTLSGHRLNGEAVVKVSLKTGDLALAWKRWSEVHPQVERLIEKATARVRQDAAAGAPAVDRPPMAAPASAETAPARSLTSEDRAAIAEQARHDLITEDDQAWADPDSLVDPLARGLELALKSRDAGEFNPLWERRGIQRPSEWEDGRKSCEQGDDRGASR